MLTGTGLLANPLPPPTLALARCRARKLGPYEITANSTRATSVFAREHRAANRPALDDPITEPEEASSRQPEAWQSPNPSERSRRPEERSGPPEEWLQRPEEQFRS